MLKDNKDIEMKNNNNELKVDLDITDEYVNSRSLLIRLTAFVICSALYLFCISQGHFQKNIENTIIKEIRNYMNSIMIFCHSMTIFSILVFIYFILNLINKTKFSTEIRKSTLKFGNNALNWLIILPICALILAYCFSFVFTITDVFGASMIPTVHPNDQLVIFYKNEFERFDIIAVDIKKGNYQEANEKTYLKRIIGLPGDYIEYRFDGYTTYLYINGNQIEEFFYDREISPTYNNPYNSDILFDWNKNCFYTEDYIQKQCEILNDNYIIPDGFYFALGDNRIVSIDSRTIGLIHHDDILGVASYKMNSIFSYDRLDK